MKKIILILSMVMTTISNAQTPSDNELKTKIKANYKGLSSLVLEGNGATEKKFENGTWNFYYRRSFHAGFKNPEYPGVTGVVYGSVRYIKAGGSYVFHNFSSRGTKMEGVPAPDKKEVLALLNSDLYKFVGHNDYNTIVGNISEIIVPEKTEYNWDDLTHVEFNVKTIFTKKISDTELEKAEHIYEVHLYSDGFKKPWKKFMAIEDDYAKKVISKTKHSSEELSNMLTLAETDEANQVEAQIASLPWVEEAPKFETDKQLFYYIHDKLMASEPKAAKAHLYKVLSTTCFEKGAVLNGRSKEWIDRLFENLNAYQRTYCQYPIVKEEQAGMMTFYDKDSYRSTRMTAKEENGTWKLSLIYFIPPEQSEINRLWKLKGNCAEKPDLTVKIVKEFKIGDIVDVAFSNGTFPAEVKKRDTNFDNRYFVSLLEGGRGYWVTENAMTISTAKPTNNSTKTENQHETIKEKESVNFNIGDAVGIRTRSGIMTGTIIKLASHKFLIKLDEEGYQDMWVSTANLIKN
ncbi:MAG: hypothetical protein QM495_05155 [Lutibacter sp.]|uniref:hypothetical protein n=1 Tax=Lutibacter sp. TaxID=1925666 RepID=UPI00385D0E70